MQVYYSLFGTPIFPSFVLKLRWKESMSIVLSKRQPALWLHNLYVEVLTVHGNQLHLSKHTPISWYLCHAPDITEVDIMTSLVWRDVVQSRTRHLPDVGKLKLYLPSPPCSLLFWTNLYHLIYTWPINRPLTKEL